MAKKVKGVTIKIGADTSAFTKGIKSADSTLRGTQKELSQLKKALKFNPGNIELLKQKEDVLNESISETRKKLELLKSKQSEVEKQFRNGDIGAAEYRKFQREIIETDSKLEHYTRELKETKQETKRAEKEASSLKSQFGHFKDKVKDTAHQIPGLNRVLDKMDNKMKDSEKETGKFKKAVGGIGKIVKGMGKAVGVSMAAVGAGVAAVSVAIGKGVQKAAEYGDKIGDESQKLRMSRAEYQELAYAAEICGTNMNTLKKAQKTLAQKYPDLSMTEALKKCADSADVAGTATEMFGAKAAQELLPMLNEGSAGIDEMTKRAHEMGMVMSDEAISASDMFQDSLSGLKNTFNTLINTLMSNMLPGFTQVFDGLSGLLVGADGAKEQVIAGAKDIIDSISGVLPRFMDIISSVLNVLLEIAPKIISSLLTALIGILPEAISKIQDILQAILSAIVDNAPVIAEAVVSLVKMLADFLVANAVQVVDAALQIIIILAQSLAPALPNILVAVVDCVLRVVDLLLDNIDLLIDCVLEIVLAIAEALPTLCVKIFEKIPSIIIKLYRVILKAIPKLLSAVWQIVKSIVSALGKAYGSFVSATVSIIGKIITAIRNKVHSFTSAVKDVISRIITAISSKVKSFIDIGKNLIKGMVQGIQSMGAWVWNKISAFCKGIVDKVKVFFGIHSPSTLFAYFGEMLAEGLGLGFTKNMKAISDDMVNAVPNNFESSFMMHSSGDSDNSSGFEYVGINEVALKKILSEVISEGMTVQVNGKPFGRMIRNVNA